MVSMWSTILDFIFGPEEPTEIEVPKFTLRNRKIHQAYWELLTETGREPTHREIFERMYQ